MDLWLYLVVAIPVLLLAFSPYILKMVLKSEVNANRNNYPTPDDFVSSLIIPKKIRMFSDVANVISSILITISINAVVELNFQTIAATKLYNAIVVSFAAYLVSFYVTANLVFSKLVIGEQHIYWTGPLFLLRWSKENIRNIKSVSYSLPGYGLLVIRYKSGNKSIHCCVFNGQEIKEIINEMMLKYGGDSS